MSKLLRSGFVCIIALLFGCAQIRNTINVQSSQEYLKDSDFKKGSTPAASYSFDTTSISKLPQMFVLKFIHCNETWMYLQKADCAVISWEADSTKPILLGDSTLNANHRFNRIVESRILPFANPDSGLSEYVKNNKIDSIGLYSYSYQSLGWDWVNFYSIGVLIPIIVVQGIVSNFVNNGSSYWEKMAIADGLVWSTLMLSYHYVSNAQYVVEVKIHF